MSQALCPACSLEDILDLTDHWECSTCGHEWPKEAAAAGPRIVKDAFGNVLADGDAVTLIKDLPLRGQLKWYSPLVPASVARPLSIIRAMRA